MNTPTSSTDIIAALGALTAEELRERLHALDAERRAVLVLLRSVAARERAQRRAAKQGETLPCTD